MVREVAPNSISLQYMNWIYAAEVRGKGCGSVSSFEWGFWRFVRICCWRKWWWDLWRLRIEWGGFSACSAAWKHFRWGGVRVEDLKVCLWRKWGMYWSIKHGERWERCGGRKHGSTPNYKWLGIWLRSVRMIEWWWRVRGIVGFWWSWGEEWQLYRAGSWDW